MDIEHKTISVSEDRSYAVQVLELMLDANDRMVRHLRQNRDYYAQDPQRARSWVRDYRTLRLCMGQRSGQTVAASTLAQDHDLVVHSTAQSREWWAPIPSSKFPGIHVTADQALTDQEIQEVPPTIWVLDPSRWGEPEFTRLRDLWVQNVDQRIVVLGWA